MGWAGEGWEGLVLVLGEDIQTYIRVGGVFKQACVYNNNNNNNKRFIRMAVRN